ncbi:MAG TPA: hypothetical protein PKI59_03480 [Candidatus Cloacimonadota bacterium]|nr:hypothetical protein [Candidatus Cloacimonadota bacterium]
MSTKHTRILQELDPETVEGYTEAQKRYYLNGGYRPYLDENGKVKWLTLTQYSMRGDISYKAPRIRLLPPKKLTNQRRRRPHRTMIVKFVREYWLTIMLVLLSVMTVMVFITRPEFVMAIGDLF